MDKIDWQKKGNGHRQRLRDKFLEIGIDGFTDAEVLELLLTLGTPRKDCKEPAREALLQFGSFSAVLEAPVRKLQEVKGIGPKNGFAIKFIHAAADRYLEKRLNKKEYLLSSTQVADYLRHSMIGLKHEVFKTIFLDSSNAIIITEDIAEGSINSNTIYPRELIKLALKHHAASIVIAHNHPSGSVKPSNEDRKLTSSLYLACSLIQIRLLDHLIIGSGNQVFSFADHGLINEIHQQHIHLLQ
jgi:DNA repair protein RadC